MTDWQPIETAPKGNLVGEGPEVLLWVPEDSLEYYRINVGFWWPMMDGWCRINAPEGDTKFWKQPSHWMPLPEPPK